MSEEASDFPDLPEVPTDAPPRVRRISNKRPKKTAPPVEEVSLPEVPVAMPDEAPSAPAAEPAPVVTSAESESADDANDAEPAAADWADPETSGGGSGSETAKRKRRRKKGKGGGQAPAVQETVMPLVADSAQSGDDAPEPPAPRERPERQVERHSERPERAERPERTERPQPPLPVQQRSKVDPEELAKRAWKIYLAEVSEEGVALIGDADARELSRRCFRLAEIFIEEQSRRR
jgi:hypothetical protein